MRTTGTTATRAALALSAVLLAGALAGCGGSGSSAVAQDPGASAPTTPAAGATGSTPPRGPTCGHVWRGGTKLPADYRGCAAGAAWVKADVYQCSDGHRVVTYAHEFYATPGRTISRAATTLAKDGDFKQTMAACGA